MPTPTDFPSAFEITDLDDPHEMLAGPFYQRKGGTISEVFLQAERKHCNTGGMIHGGLLVTMADLALCAACREGAEGIRAITVSLNSEFLSAGKEGDFVEAKAQLTRRGKSMAFARCDIVADGKTLMTASAVTRLVPKQ